MKAFQLLAHGQPGRFAWHEIPDPVPAPGEVVVAVQACGLNHLDLWLEQGALPIPLQLPRTPGCEIAGRVLAMAPDVTGWRTDEAVAIQSNIFCGECAYCREGQESMCLQAVMLGVQRDGGLAERVCVPARALVRLPPGVESRTSAALTLAGSTAMHMLTDRARVEPGQWVLVLAAGSGVGSAAIQIARHLGARVVATGSTDAKRALGLSLGAEAAIDSTDPKWPAEVRRLTAKRGADLIVEHVGGETLIQCLECLARGGTLVTCGATTGREVRLDLWPLFVKQLRIVGSYGRNSSDLRRTLEWAAAGKLKPVIHEVFPLAKAAEALARLRDRAVLGKLLVEP